jgi:2-oxoisovalerate dehydrogenase E2 component (dihydrolipoyl transacylase)
MAKTTRVVMPQLGESVHEGTISKWLVKPGDKVVEFEPMLEVDTDKVNAEVPAPVTGILREILAKEGETVQAGAEIAVVEVGSEGPDGADGKASDTPEAPAPASAAAPPKAPPEKAVAQKAAPAEPAQEQPAEPAAEEEPAEDLPSPRRGAIGESEPPRAGAQGQGEGQAQSTTVETGEHRYSPAVQMQASELKVDLSKVAGTGIGGRVTKKDVLDFATSAKPAPAAAAPAPAVMPGQGDEVVQLTRVRRLIAENMVRSKTTIPHAWQTQEADMSGVVANRTANKAAFQKQEGFSLTYLPYVMAATASALREHSQVNATFNETELIIHRNINLGISVGLEDTLIVPVVRRADGLSIAGLARAVNDIASRAKVKQLKADDLAGATFTVNNSGTFGTLFSYSVINPGQAGILTMEAIVDRPMAVNGMIGIKPMMYLCFSFDHRVLDGLQAARFLTSCRKWLEAVTAESPIY